MSQGGVQPVQEQGSSTDLGALVARVNQIAQRINLMLRGKVNISPQQSLTLTAGATTTTVTDERIGNMSYLGFMPITDAAATAWSSIRVKSRLKGSAVITHASAAATDQTFVVAIQG